MIRHVEGNIRVTKIPGGEAPLEVREKWVGLVLPVVGISSNDVQEVLSLKKTGFRGLHFWCLRSSRSLSLKNTISMRRIGGGTRGFPLPGCDFSIQLDEAEVVGRLKNIVLKEVRQFVGLLEVGVGAHDYPANN